jgi:hypothetical protein
MLSFRSSPRSWGLRNGVLAVGIIFSAVLLYQRFLQDAPSLWYSAVHDRNGHYRRSQGFACAIRQGNVGGVIHQIHAATVWPPLHPLLTGVVLAVGGTDYRLAVLPSLAGWVATCWFAFSLARRLAPRYKSLAGGIALLFTFASPAHRAYATDIMLESLGAALTLATLHFYVIARQEGSAWSGRCFGLLLLALFLTKYNYWTLLSAGLLLGTMFEFRVKLYHFLSAYAQSHASPQRSVAGRLFDWVHVQLSQPLTYLLLASFALACHVRFVGPVTCTVMGQRVEIETLDFPAQLFFVFLLLRVLPWWWHSGRHAAAQLPVPARQLVHWHIYPLAIWFLWPRRLGIFLWYITFTQHGRSGPSSPWTGNFTYYWQCLLRDYHANAASLVLVLVLIALAVIGRRRPAGQLPVLVFLASAALLTNYHSANRSRFLHSWLAVGWVVAGIGAARGIEQINRHFLRRPIRTAGAAGRSWIGRRARRFAPRAVIWGALGGLACLQGSVLVQQGHSQEGGTQTTRPSLLPIADAVCSELHHARQPIVVSNEPFAWLLDWRLAEYRSGASDPSPAVRQVPRELLVGAFPERLDAWLRQNTCDLLIRITALVPADRESSSGSLGSSVADAEWHFTAPLNLTVQIWRSFPTQKPEAQAKEHVVPSLAPQACMWPDWGAVSQARPAP